MSFEDKVRVRIVVKEDDSRTFYLQWKVFGLFWMDEIGGDGYISYAGAVRSAKSRITKRVVYREVDI